MNLDTTIEGSPAGLRAVATWLRDDFGAAAEALGSSVHTQRSRAASDWQGLAGEAFQGRARTLALAADDTQASALRSAETVDDLAAALNAAHDGMERVRAQARSGGLVVTGMVIHRPGPAPAEAGPGPVDPTPAEARAWQAGNDAVLDHNARVRAWNAATTDAARVAARWDQALTGSASAWQKWDKELVGVSADFLTAGVQVELIRRVVPVLVGQAEYYRTRAGQLRTHAAALTGPEGRVAPASRAQYYDLLDQADDLELRRAPAVYDEAVRFKLPKGVGRGLGVLGVLATGFSIHEDIDDGESVAQATVSNVAGMGASIAAGALVGGAIGTAIPVPILGTVTGVVVGAVVGTVVGAFTSGVIDAAWENGLDDLGEAGDAVMAGVGEIADTGVAIGDLAGDVWDAIF